MFFHYLPQLFFRDIDLGLPGGLSSRAGVWVASPLILENKTILQRQVQNVPRIPDRYPRPEYQSSPVFKSSLPILNGLKLKLFLYIFSNTN